MATGQQKADYYDHSSNHSYNVQVIVDSKGQVLSAFCGSPGSLHDARVLRNSGFHRRLLAGRVLNGPSISVGGVEIPQYLGGDAGYPLLQWLMVPYPGGGQTPEKANFVHKQSQTRMPVECFFGYKKQCHQILKAKINLKMKLIPELIKTCLHLHNWMMDHGEIGDGDVV
jgi:hypothetical protein